MSIELEARSKSVATPACLPALPSLHMRYGWQALRQAGRNAALSPTLRFGEQVGVQARSH